MNVPDESHDEWEYEVVIVGEDDLTVRQSIGPESFTPGTDIGDVLNLLAIEQKWNVFFMVTGDNDSIAWGFRRREQAGTEPGQSQDDIATSGAPRRPLPAQPSDSVEAVPPDSTSQGEHDA